MHPPEVRRLARELQAEGVAFAEICARLGVPKGTVGHWLYGERSRRQPPPVSCPRCATPARSPESPASYAYLLGQYLGDGHIQRYARAHLLSIYCDERYPGIIREIELAMLASQANTIRRRQLKGCVGVQSYSKHWPCLFPQAGPGRKHERPIVLAPWQEQVVSKHPGPFARGLFHSDGCRVVNRVSSAGRRYEYPRYLFANESADIMALCATALDRLGVAWRLNRRNSLSVARKESVAVLDAHRGSEALTATAGRSEPARQQLPRRRPPARLA